MDDDFTDKIIQNIGIYYAKSGDAEASEKHEQLGERLDFLQEYVAKAEKQVSREQFVRIFNVFVNDKPFEVASQRQFFEWCSDTYKAKALDSDEIFGFFNEQVNIGSLKPQSLTLPAFSFIEQIFVDANADKGKLEKMPELTAKKQKKVKFGNYGATFEVSCTPKDL